MSESPLSAISHHRRVIDHLREALAQWTRAREEKTAWSTEVALAPLIKTLNEDFTRARHEAIALPDLLLAERFGLSRLEVLLLWLVVLPHVEPEGRLWVQFAQTHSGVAHVDVALCLSLLGASSSPRAALFAALSPGASLFHSGLLRRAPGEGGLTQPLLPNEQLPLFFWGVRALGPNLARFARCLDVCEPEPEALSDAQRRLLPPLRAALSGALGPPSAARGPGGLDHPRGLIGVLQGARGIGKYTLTRHLTAALETRLIVVEGDQLADAVRRGQFAEARAAVEGAVFEAALLREVICVRNADRLMGELAPLIPVLVEALFLHDAVALLCVEDGAGVDPRLDPLILLRHTLEGGLDQLEVWRRHLAVVAAEPYEARELAPLTQRITLSPMQIRKATQLGALSALGEGGRAATVDDLERAALSQVSRAIGQLAIVSEPHVRLEELVLDVETSTHIQALISAVRVRHRVLHQWGLGARIKRGTGIVAMLDGDPGTGKTHAAEAIAHELGLSLVRVNIASIVDKYIGETEKHLTRLFEQARPEVSLLLFDEADSLFAKRTGSVSGSTDRYSNMNINTLLQLIERYEGVTILTTNFKRAIDPAFERRFTFKIHFPTPQLDERVRIWRYLLPESLPLEGGVDFEELAEIELSGGEVKNAILLACYRAASRGDVLTFDDLYDAAIQEATAAGRMIRTMT